MLARLTVSCITLVVFAVAGAAQGAHDGTCKVNAAKSHYKSQPPQRADTVTVTTDATSYHVDIDMTMPDGQTLKAGMSFPLNGGPMETHGLPPDPKADHSSARIVNKDKWIFSYYDKDNKLTSTRVVTYKGSESEAKWMMNGKVIDDEFCEKQ